MRCFFDTVVLSWDTVHITERTTKLRVESHAEYPTKGPSKQSTRISHRVNTRRSYVSDSIIDGRDPFMEDSGKKSGQIRSWACR